MGIESRKIHSPYITILRRQRPSITFGQQLQPFPGQRQLYRPAFVGIIGLVDGAIDVYSRLQSRKVPVPEADAFAPRMILVPYPIKWPDAFTGGIQFG